MKRQEIIDKLCQYDVYMIMRNINENDYDWLEEFAESAGFIVNDDHTMEVPDDMDLDELLENFANIIAQVAVQQFVTKMTDNMRGEETLH